MAKEEIKKLIENSKKTLDQDKDNFAKSIKEDLSGFKKNTLTKIEFKILIMI